MRWPRAGEHLHRRRQRRGQDAPGHGDGPRGPLPRSDGGDRRVHPPRPLGHAGGRRHEGPAAPPLPLRCWPRWRTAAGRGAAQETAAAARAPGQGAGSPTSPPWTSCPASGAAPPPAPGQPRGRARPHLHAPSRRSSSPSPRRNPLLLILDDLQWADELTLGFLRAAAGTRSLVERGVLLLGTYRMEELDEPLSEVVSAPARCSWSWDGSTSTSIQSMVCGMLALRSLPRGLRRTGAPVRGQSLLRRRVPAGRHRRGAAPPRRPPGSGGWTSGPPGRCSSARAARAPSRRSSTGA